MTDLERQQLMQEIIKLTNNGQHLKAKALYDKVMADKRRHSKPQ